MPVEPVIPPPSLKFEVRCDEATLGTSITMENGQVFGTDYRFDWMGKVAELLFPPDQPELDGHVPQVHVTWMPP